MLALGSASAYFTVDDTLVYDFPPIYSYMTGCVIIVYTTLDAVDGIHARTTGTASALG